MSGEGGSSFVKARSLICPNCGGTIELKGFAHTLSAACSFCGSILDTSTPVLRLVQAAQKRQQIEPLIPLGSRGTIDSIEWQAIGYQIRSVNDGEDSYSWNEFLLFNPYRGFRYLTEYGGHWNFVRTLGFLPEPSMRAMRIRGRSYRQCQFGQARTTYVMGEFPWQVRLGEEVKFNDYVAAPEILSSEKTAEGSEITWSLGRYISGKEVWNAFHLKGKPPGLRGISANQISPYQGKVFSLWIMYFLAVLVMAGFMVMSAMLFSGGKVFEQSYVFNPQSTAEPSFVTNNFQLSSRGSNVRVSIHTDLQNSWAYFNLALINTSDGHAYNFGREVSFYQGQDSDGHWSEGDNDESVTVGPIPAGEYYLRIEPEMDKQGTLPMHYSIVVQRGVVAWGLYVLALFLLAVPPVIRTIRALSFNQARSKECE